MKKSCQLAILAVTLTCLSASAAVFHSLTIPKAGMGVCEYYRKVYECKDCTCFSFYNQTQGKDIFRFKLDGEHIMDVVADATILPFSESKKNTMNVEVTSQDGTEIFFSGILPTDNGIVCGRNGAGEKYCRYSIK